MGFRRHGIPLLKEIFTSIRGGMDMGGSQRVIVTGLLFLILIGGGIALLVLLRGGGADDTVLVPGGTYTCSFTWYLSGPINGEHFNLATATGQDNEGNQDSDEDDETVIFCAECKGGVTELTLRYIGVPSPVVIRVDAGSHTVYGPTSHSTGDEFSFYLITKVDPGYVLDADATGTHPDLIAEDTSRIGSSTTDFRLQNNQDTEQTEIIAEADLAVSKTDTPDPGLPDAFLSITGYDRRISTGLQKRGHKDSHIQLIINDKSNPFKPFDTFIKIAIRY